MQAVATVSEEHLINSHTDSNIQWWSQDINPRHRAEAVDLRDRAEAVDLRDRAETETVDPRARAETVDLRDRAETKTLKNVSRGSLEPRQCLEDYITGNITCYFMSHFKYIRLSLSHWIMIPFCLFIQQLLSFLLFTWQVEPGVHLAQ